MKNWSLLGSQSRPGLCEEQENLLRLAGIEHQFFGCRTHSLVCIPKTLSWMYKIISFVQTPSWVADNLWIVQGIAYLSRNTRFHYRVYSSSPLDLVLSRAITMHNWTTALIFNLILSSHLHLPNTFLKTYLILRSMLPYPPISSTLTWLS
jgi:hypothetical protein